MRKKEYKSAASMHNPPHPGVILKDSIIDSLGLTVKEAATYLDVDRTTLSRLLNGHTAVSVDMALRLAKALNTSPDVWLGLQRAHDIWHAQNNIEMDLSNVKPFASVDTHVHS
ncbi:MAG: HigA family addiction module antitoxin [Rickettsiales bacterium]